MQWNALRNELGSAAATRRFVIPAAGTTLFATLALLGAEFVALYAAFMAHAPASVFVSLQAVTAVALLSVLIPLFRDGVTCALAGGLLV